MERNMQTRVTKSMEAVNNNLVADVCCEPDCGITLLVDKDEKAQGRKQRCTACTMRMKLRK